MQVGGRAPLRHPGLVFGCLFGVVLTLDQLTKVAVRALWSSPALLHPLDRLLAPSFPPVFEPRESLPLLGEWLQLSFVRNQGAAFGLLPGQRLLFVATSLLVLAILAVYWWRERPRSVLVVTALSLAAAGAVGNLIDRLLLGNVTDFIDVAAISFPVFNVADSAIFIGVAILIGWLLLSKEHDRDEPGVEHDGGENVD